MRPLRIGIWLSAFLLAASVPAFCQVIVPPNVSGKTIPVDSGTAAFQQQVFSTGNFNATLLVFQDLRLKFFASADICTTGPLTTICFDVPFGQFGLDVGDAITFALRITHLGTEDNTRSLTISVIPVVAGSSPPPPPPPPPPTSMRTRTGEPPEAPAFARKEEALV